MHKFSITGSFKLLDSIKMYVNDAAKLGENIVEHLLFLWLKIEKVKKFELFWKRHESICHAATNRTVYELDASY